MAALSGCLHRMRLRHLVPVIKSVFSADFARGISTASDVEGTQDAARQIGNSSKRNVKLMDILEPLPAFGAGTKVSKESWHDESYWHIVHVHPKKRSFTSPEEVASERLAAKIYGVKYWNGQPETGRVKQVRGQKKKIWRQVGLQDDVFKMHKIISILDEEWKAQLAPDISQESSQSAEGSGEQPSS